MSDLRPPVPYGAPPAAPAPGGLGQASPAPETVPAKAIAWGIWAVFLVLGVVVLTKVDPLRSTGYQIGAVLGTASIGLLIARTLVRCLPYPERLVVWIAAPVCIGGAVAVSVLPEVMEYRETQAAPITKVALPSSIGVWVRAEQGKLTAAEMFPRRPEMAGWGGVDGVWARYENKGRELAVLGMNTEPGGRLRRELNGSVSGAIDNVLRGAGVEAVTMPSGLEGVQLRCLTEASEGMWTCAWADRGSIGSAQWYGGETDISLPEAAELTAGILPDVRRPTD